MVILLLTGRCYEAEICAILLLLRYSTLLHDIVFFCRNQNFQISAEKTMDYSKAF